MTEESENKVPLEGMEAEEPAAQTSEVTAEEKKQRWSTVVIGVIAALLALCALVVCIAAAVAALSGGKGTASVTGTVIYRERIALEPDAVVEVQIQDVSWQDVAATVMGEQVIRNAGQVPIRYEVAYDPKAIQDNHTYSVRARIEDGSGNLLFTSTQTYPVITRGAPTKDVQILVERVSVEPSPPAQAFIKIDEPVHGAILDINGPITVWGSGAGLPEGNVVVQALDQDGNVLVEQPTTLQGENVGLGGQGTWSVALMVDVRSGTVGRLMAFSPSPLDGSYVASTVVNVTYGGPPALEGTYWILADTLPGTEVKALFKKGQVIGSAGCNSYSGLYVTTTVAGVSRIQIEPLASTMMMCEEAVMDQEIAYLAALQSATSYAIEGNLLTILHPDGTLLFEGEPVR